MKISFSPQGIPYEDIDGNHEVESALLHRYSLADDEVVDKYPGKTDREVQVIEHAVAIAAAEAQYQIELKAAQDKLAATKSTWLAKLNG